jgi:hypothetical protein
MANTENPSDFQTPPEEKDLKSIDPARIENEKRALNV